jgi:hypothetical protein
MVGMLVGDDDAREFVRIFAGGLEALESLST